MNGETVLALYDDARSTWHRVRDGVVSVFEHIGSICQLAGRTFAAAIHGGVAADEVIEQIEAIGLRSISVAALTAVFSSMVMTVQFAVQMTQFGAKEYVGSVVSLSLFRELGPGLTALMVGGRVGAGIAAELGSMNVTEQIDALRSMGADPVRKLVVPRVLATLVSLPLLSAFADVAGVLAAMGIARVSEGINMTYFYNEVLRSVILSDFLGGLAKTLVFGLLISLIACYQGLMTTGGTEGVGRAATRTVVVCSITTFVSDFILTSLLLSFGF